MKEGSSYRDIVTERGKRRCDTEREKRSQKTV